MHDTKYMSDSLHEFCKSTDCDVCPFHNAPCYHHNWDDDEDCIREDYYTLHPEDRPTEPAEPAEPVEDVVNHPNHYTYGGMECIDEMILVFGKAAVKHFCLCNVWKYRKRALYKNKEEDLAKADWYMNKYKELGDDYGEQTITF